MTDMTQFNFHGHGVRVIPDEHGEPWFVAADVAKILGYSSTPALVRRIDSDDKGMRVLHTPGGDQQMSVITEPGLYIAVLGSQVEGAREFKRWVTGEVLPSIRKTGSYGQAQLTGPELMAAALIEAQATLAAKDKEIQTLAPKASRYDTFLGADGDYPLRDTAQILSRDHGIKIGQNNLARWMRDNSWIDRKGIPYQHRIDAGHLRSKPRTYKHPRTGEDVAADPQVRITPRGLDLLAKRLAGPTLVEVSA